MGDRRPLRCMRPPCRKPFARADPHRRRFRICCRKSLSKLPSPGVGVVATIHALQPDYLDFSEKSPRILWQNRSDPKTMSKFASWALIASVCLVWGWAQAGPPRASQRGPVVIEPPVAEADPVDEPPVRGRFLT